MYKLLGMAAALFTLACTGCAQHTEDISKEWTPAKAGMSQAQFFKMAHDKMANRPAFTPGTAPAQGGANAVKQ